jgi:uncharacterized protein
VSVIPDVNLLLAYGWKSHPEHPKARIWLGGLSDFSTCPITELGFLRVSMSPAYKADFNSALTVLNAIRKLNGARFLYDDSPAANLPLLSSYKDVTDAYLVTLARSHGLRLATLDSKLIAEVWAAGIAYRPFTP